MAVRNTLFPNGQRSVLLLDDAGEPVQVVNDYLRHLAARNCSPNTLIAYAHDLQHLWRFLTQQRLEWQEFRVWHTVELLGYLRSVRIPLSPRRRGADDRRKGNGATGPGHCQPDTCSRLVVL